jgi:hypothetical protein
MSHLPGQQIDDRLGKHSSASIENRVGIQVIRHEKERDRRPILTSASPLTISPSN